jgi:hypothetical protein
MTVINDSKQVVVIDEKRVVISSVRPLLFLSLFHPLVFQQGNPGVLRTILSRYYRMA